MAAGQWKNTIPSPPTHCDRVRQKRSAWGSRSTSFTMVAPVVVNPDMASKYASVKLVMYPLMRNGSAPMSEKTTQVSDTTM